MRSRSGQIKISYQLSKHSKTKILLYAMHTSPMEIYMLKRKLNFLKKLANNEATADLLALGCHNTVEEVLNYLNINYERDILMGKMAYLTKVMKKYFYKVKEIIRMEKRILNSEIVRSVRYLLNNRNDSNDDTVQFLLDPRRYKTG
jgi:flagellar motor switch protein FliG